jgi:hypothetical protein
MNLRLLSLSVLLVAVASFAVACGASSGSDDATGLAKFTPSETIYALDDLLEIGFKKDKSFDVEGLTAATHAYYGFWGVDPYDRKEYEARFYPSHSDAVEFGVAFADERTGPDAVIKAGETMWEVRRTLDRALVHRATETATFRSTATTLSTEI